MYNHTNCDSTWPFITHVPSPGYWYFIHGGAGAIMSRGLMGMTSFERCQEFITNGPMPRMSGGNARIYAYEATPMPQVALTTAFYLMPDMYYFVQWLIDLFFVVAIMQPASCLVHHHIGLRIITDVTLVIHQH